eukprot:356877-Chlamydomonas_euryale.AAC.2
MTTHAALSPIATPRGPFPAWQRPHTPMPVAHAAVGAGFHHLHLAHVRGRRRGGGKRAAAVRRGDGRAGRQRAGRAGVDLWCVWWVAGWQCRRQRGRRQCRKQPGRRHCDAAAAGQRVAAAAGVVGGGGGGAPHGRGPAVAAGCVVKRDGGRGGRCDQPPGAGRACACACGAAAWQGRSADAVGPGADQLAAQPGKLPAWTPLCPPLVAGLFGRWQRGRREPAPAAAPPCAGRGAGRRAALPRDPRRRRHWEGSEEALSGVGQCHVAGGHAVWPLADVHVAGGVRAVGRRVGMGER